MFADDMILYIENTKDSIRKLLDLISEFSSDDHYIYYCGQESLKRNGVAIMVNKKSLKCSTWMQS